MHHFPYTFLYAWSKSAAIILVAACIIPGFSIYAPVAALQEAVVFGLLAASLRPFFEWIEMPVNACTLAFFGFMLNGAFIFWTSTVIPGFWVCDLSAAAILIAVLTALDTRVSLGLALVPAAVPVEARVMLKRAQSLAMLVPEYAKEATITSKTKTLVGNAARLVAPAAAAAIGVIKSKSMKPVRFAFDLKANQDFTSIQSTASVTADA